MEKINKQKLIDRLFTSLIILSLAILITHLFTLHISRNKNIDSNQKLPMQIDDSLTEPQNSVWKNMEFMKE